MYEGKENIEIHVEERSMAGMKEMTNDFKKDVERLIHKIS